jgi:hypothetical protein
MELKYVPMAVQAELTSSPGNILHFLVSSLIKTNLDLADHSIPNFILLAVPATLDPSSLNTMIAFATGGLLGDVFLHLVPHSFSGEGAEGHHRAVVVEEKRNIVIGSVSPIYCKRELII